MTNIFVVLGNFIALIPFKSEVTFINISTVSISLNWISFVMLTITLKQIADLQI